MSAGTKPALPSFNQNNYKPVSRILLSRMVPGRLSFIWDAARTTPLSANPRTSGEPPSIVRLFGISARKVYPNAMLPLQSVGSYTTFSPLPPVLKAVIFCGTLCNPVARAPTR